MSQALDSWRKKLDSLQQQEAIVAEPAQKFALAEQINEAKAKIAELEATPLREPASEPSAVRADLSRTIKPAYSVCTTTKRSNPQLDRMIRLLMAQTVSDFEYLIVDGYYHTRRDYMARLIGELNPPFRVRHIPPKPSRWEHIRPALCSALTPV